MKVSWESNYYNFAGMPSVMFFCQTITAFLGPHTLNFTVKGLNKGCSPPEEVERGRQGACSLLFVKNGEYDKTDLISTIL